MYAELLQLQITHPFHPKCRLFFQANHRKHACNSCKKGSYTFVFRCNLCHFNICVGYSYLSPTRKYEGHDHDHLLCVSELDRNHGICSAYYVRETYIEPSYILTWCSSPTISHTRVNIVQNYLKKILSSSLLHSLANLMHTLKELNTVSVIYHGLNSTQPFLHPLQKA